MKFYKMPKELFDNEQYSSLSMGAKLLYMMLLDRYYLSLHNEWFDEDGRTYIIYTVKEAVNDLGCGKTSVSKFFKELISCGLIEKQRRNCCLSDIIYVNMVDEVAPECEPREEYINKEETPKNYAKPDVDNYDYGCSLNELDDLLFGEPVSECVPPSTEMWSSDDRNAVANNTKYNNTNWSNTENNTFDNDVDIDKEISAFTHNVEKCYSEVKERIGYSTLAAQYGRGSVDSLVENLVEVLSLRNVQSYSISGQVYPFGLVKKRFESVDFDIADYILKSMTSVKSDIKYLKRYLMTVIFNAPTTVEQYYQREVSRDMRRGKFNGLMTNYNTGGLSEYNRWMPRIA